MNHPFNAADVIPSVTLKYCDRCARRSRALLYDDLAQQDLCQDCGNRLKRRREVSARPAITGM